MDTISNFSSYISHYFSMPDILKFFLVTCIIVCAIHGYILIRARMKSKVSIGSEAAFQTFKSLKEQYYEMTFSSASMLLFTGIYFAIDFRWIPMTSAMVAFWEKYNDFILLGLMVLSIVLINILDNLLIPLKKLGKDEIGYLRMASMIYMLILFVYIKFIYLDDNYDTIVFYFVVMLVSRFVYVDASVKDFRQSMRGLKDTMPFLALALLSTALLAWYGFRSDYLLTENSVALSLFIAQCFVIFVCFLLTVTHVANGIARKILIRNPKKRQKKSIDEDIEEL